MASWTRVHKTLMCLWPGLPGLWIGQFGGLMAALLFAAILQTAIIVCLIWPDLLTTGGRLVVCFGVALYWLAFAIPQALQLAQTSRMESRPDLRGHLFQSAQTEYLRGNLFQAEQLLNQLLEQCPTDFEAKLYLTTLYRRINRFDEALAGLEELEHEVAASEWRWELHQERRWIRERIEQQDHNEKAADSRKSNVVTASDAA